MTEIRKPAFARDWPNDSELDQLVAAFVRGNYRAVRSEAPRVERSARERGDEIVAAKARELQERVKPDPMGKALLLIAFLLLALVTVAAYSGNIRP